MMRQYETEDEIRDAFWNFLPQTVETARAFDKWERGARQNDLPTDIRCAFVDFVDYLAKSDQITEELAFEVTL